MNKVIYALSGLLVLQVAAGVGMSLSSRSFASEAAGTKLLSFSANQISRLAITGASGKSVVLAKAGKSWTVESAGGFPADSTKITSLIGDLAKAQEGPAVATTAGATKRFQVTRAAFNRKLVFGPAKAPLATVYLGNSQGTRQVYVRRAGQHGVRLMDFGLYRVSANAGDWIDSNALQITPKTIKSISWGDVTLNRVPGPTTSKTVASKAATTTAKGTPAKSAKPAAKPVWEVAFTGQKAKPIKASAVQSLTTKLSSLYVIGLSKTVPKPGAAGAARKLDLSIMLDGGKTRDYRLFKMKGGNYVLAASNLPRAVKLSQYTAKALIKAADGKDFVPPAAKPAQASTPAPAPARATTGG